MGVVYDATQTFPGGRQGVKRKVVVKLIRPELIMHQSEWAIGRFQTELRNLVQLNHPRIVRLYDAGIYHDAVHCEDVPFLAMEHIAGETLRTYARQRKPLGVKRALEPFSLSATLSPMRTIRMSFTWISSRRTFWLIVAATCT